MPTTLYSGLARLLPFWARTFTRLGAMINAVILAVFISLRYEPTLGFFIGAGIFMILMESIWVSFCLLTWKLLTGTLERIFR
jgi:hypothetical protein